MKKVNYSKNKLRDKIIHHFRNEGRDEYSENRTTQFNFSFEDSVHNLPGLFIFDVIYDIDTTKVIEQITVHDAENYEYKLNLKKDNYNPTRLTIYDEIQKIRYDRNREDFEDSKEVPYFIERERDY